MGYLFVLTWGALLERRVSGFKVGGPMQTESGWSGRKASKGESERTHTLGMSVGRNAEL